MDNRMNDEQLLRYSRQLMLKDFDVAGQERLLASSVLVVGLGGLGSPVALYLAAAGVGELILADDDSVEPSNLQRQIAHGEADLGINKAESAAASVRALNPDCRVQVLALRLQAEQLADVVAGVNLVVDATDNFSSRFAINRASVAAGVPLVSGAAIRSEGQVGVFDPARGGPCYQCLYQDDASDEDLSCSESGVLAPVVGVIGSLQALEAVKVLAEYGEPLRGAILIVDAWSMQIRRLTVNARSDCPVCG